MGIDPKLDTVIVARGHEHFSRGMPPYRLHVLQSIMAFAFLDDYAVQGYLSELNVLLSRSRRLTGPSISTILICRTQTEARFLVMSEGQASAFAAQCVTCASDSCWCFQYLGMPVFDINALILMARLSLPDPDSLVAAAGG